MRWKWLTEKEYRSEAGQRRVNDPRFLDPTFPASFRRCFQVKEGNLDVIGVISKVEKQLIVGGILDENPDALRDVYKRQANPLVGSFSTPCA